MRPTLRPLAQAVAGAAPRVLGALLLLGAFFALTAAFEHNSPGFDTDRPFHIAVSREAALALEDGRWIRALPQVEDLGWGKAFPDKEPLFHVLTTAGYLAGGEAGVVAAVRLTAALLLVLLFACVSRRLGAALGLLTTLALLLGAPVYSERLTLVRPHVLASLLLVVLCLALAHRRPAAAALAASAFAWAYHALYLPLLVLLAASLSPLGPSVRKPVVLALVGLFTGALLHPAFPENISLMLVHVGVGIRGALPPGMEAGGEMDPYPPLEMLVLFSSQWLALAVVAVRVAQARVDEQRQRALFFLLVAAGFFALSFVSPRALEYAVPSTVLALAALPEGPPRWRRLVVAALLVAGAVHPLLVWRSQLLLTPRDPRRQELADAVVEGARAIPEEGVKVLTCDWGLGAYVFYARRDLRFVDVLEPRLLARADPERFELLAAWKAGRVVDHAGFARDVFAARYILCQRADLNARMSGDPNLELVWRSDNTTVALWRVVDGAAARAPTTSQ